MRISFAAYPSSYLNFFSFVFFDFSPSLVACLWYFQKNFRLLIQSQRESLHLFSVLDSFAIEIAFDGHNFVQLIELS